MIATKIGTATLLASFFVCLSLAEDRNRTLATEMSPGAYDPAVMPLARVSANTLPATGASEVFTGITIAAGKTVSLDSTMDYSAASGVAVTVLCIICTSSQTSLGNSGLVLQARWTVPGAGSYATTENKAATTFPYWDSGGAAFGIYGPKFRLVLQNTGTQMVAIQQVTVFRRTQ